MNDQTEQLKETIRNIPGIRFWIITGFCLAMILIGGSLGPKWWNAVIGISGAILLFLISWLKGFIAK